MPELREAIQTAYIEHIKNIVCIDDEFPTFEDLLAQNPAQQNSETSFAELEDPDKNLFSQQAVPENKWAVSNQDGIPSHNTKSDNRKRVQAIVRSCHAEGYLVDVQNDYHDEKRKLIGKADLLILDYEIAQDPSKTLKTLQDLAQSPDYNLVIVYTQENIHSAAVQTACCLSDVQCNTVQAMDIDEELKKNVRENRVQLLEKPNEKFKILAKANRVKKEILQAAHNATVLEDYKVFLPIDGHIETCNLQNTTTSPWIACQNLFIVFVGKTKDDLPIQALIKALRDALHDFKPTPMTLVMQHVVSDLKKNINSKINKLMPNNTTKAAALFASLDKYIPVKDAASDESSYGYMVDHILHTMFHSAQNALSDDTKNLICKYLSKIKSKHTTFKQISTLEKCEFGSIEDFYKTLNGFICCEPSVGDHIATGSIFRIQADGKYYLCVSPECSLCNKKIKSVYAICLANTPKSSKPCDTLVDLNSNKYIFFKDKDILHCKQIDPSKVELCDFFCTSTKLENCKISLKSVKYDTDAVEITLPAVIFDDVKATVVACLRPEYAHRYMALAGAWRSRIGLDFIPMPK